MHIPALDSEEERTQIANSERVAAALSNAAYYVPLGRCNSCGGNDAVVYLTRTTDTQGFRWCAESCAFEVGAATRYPVLLRFLRRLGVDVDSYSLR